MRIDRRAWILLAALVQGGCAVGPDYERPEPALPETFEQAAAADAEAIPAAGLWQSLGNDELIRLIDRALQNNTTILQALAALEESRALSGLAVYSLFPTGTIDAGLERSGISSRDPFAFPGQTIVERYRAGFDVNWELDLFGSLRRQSESFHYLVDADEATLRATELAIVAEVAQTWFEWHGEQARLEILKANLANQADNVAILEAGLEAGRYTEFDVSRARAVERQVAAAVPTVGAAVTRAVQRLAVLTRTPAETLRDELDPALGFPALPPLVAVGTPESWFLGRPDVRAAERRLASATADIGVATAEFYPKLELTGNFGWTGAEAENIGDTAAQRWTVAPSISWRLLDTGRVRQEFLASKARAAGALAAFDEAWLTALEETENALATYRATTERAALLAEARAEAAEASRLANLRLEAGIDSYLVRLDTDRTLIELDDLLARARTDRATALAALYKALGGDFAVAATPR